MKASAFIWRSDLDAALASPHTSRGQPMDSFNARSGKTFAGLVAEMGKPVEEWTAADVEKALPRVDGIGLEQAGGRKYVWHWGDNPGFKNFVVGEPATGSAIVLFTNGNAGQRVYERVIRARTGVDHPAFLWL